MTLLVAPGEFIDRSQRIRVASPIPRPALAISEAPTPRTIVRRRCTRQRPTACIPHNGRLLPCVPHNGRFAEGRPCVFDQSSLVEDVTEPRLDRRATAAFPVSVPWVLRLRARALLDFDDCHRNVILALNLVRNI